MLFTVIILNYCLTCSAHVIPRLVEPNNLYNHQDLMKMPSQFQGDAFDDSVASHSPSPGQPRASRSKEHPDNQLNEISNTLSPEQTINMARLARVELIKQKVLKELQLSEPPNATAPIRLLPPEILQSLADHKNSHHNPQQHLEDDPETSRVFVTANTSGNIHCDQEQGAHCFRFRFERRSLDEKLTAARLWIYLQPDSNAPGIQRTIIASLPASHYGQQHILSTKDTYLQQGWVEIEFPQRHHIMKLFNDSWNFIEIRCLQHTHGVDFIDSSSSFTPILSLTYRLKRRARRQSDSTSTDTGSCHLVPFSMTFDEIDWAWVEFPLAFRADFCAGSCPGTSLSPYLNERTQIISTFNNLYSHGSERIGTPCCVPLSYANLTAVYTDGVANSSPRTMVIPNLQALTCGCVV